MRANLEKTARLRSMLEEMSADDLQDFLDGTLNAAVVASDVFRTKHPRRYDCWDKLMTIPVEGRPH